jgi:hypothetical protein
MSFIAIPVQPPLLLEYRGRYSSGETLLLNGRSSISGFLGHAAPAVMAALKQPGFRT